MIIEPLGLEEFCKNELEVITANAINQKSGTIVGSGEEPYIVGKAFGLDEFKTSKLLIGNSGIFMLKITKKLLQKIYPIIHNLLLNCNLKREKTFQV